HRPEHQPGNEGTKRNDSSDRKLIHSGGGATSLTLGAFSMTAPYLPRVCSLVLIGVCLGLIGVRSTLSENPRIA
ncbi:MAG: hypothetical protein ACR2QJ_05280, partial [Geminicoccaceae bacterium]